MSDRSATIRVADSSGAPESVITLERKARVARDIGDFQTALASYRLALLEAPMRADLRLAMAETLHESLGDGHARRAGRSSRVLSAKPPEAPARPLTPAPLSRAAAMINSTGEFLDRAFDAASSRLLARPATPRAIDDPDEVDFDGGTLQFDDPVITPPPVRAVPQAATPRRIESGPVQRPLPRPQPEQPTVSAAARVRLADLENAGFRTWNRGIPKTTIAMGLVAAGVLLIAAGATHAVIKSWIDTTAVEVDSKKVAKAPALPAELNSVLTLASDRVLSGRPSDAVEKLRAAREKYPTYASAVDSAMIVALRAEGNALSRKRDFQKAAKSFQNVVDIDPANVETWNELGRALRDQARSKEKNPVESRKLLIASESAYKHVLQNQPRNIAALFGLAQVYVAQGERAKATEAYHDVMEINPTSEEARMATLALKQLIGERVRIASRAESKKK